MSSGESICMTMADSFTKYSMDPGNESCERIPMSSDEESISSRKFLCVESSPASTAENACSVVTDRSVVCTNGTEQPVESVPNPVVEKEKTYEQLCIEWEEEKKRRIADSFWFVRDRPMRKEYLEHVESIVPDRNVENVLDFVINQVVVFVDAGVPMRTFADRFHRTPRVFRQQSDEDVVDGLMRILVNRVHLHVTRGRDLLWDVDRRRPRKRRADEERNRDPEIPQARNYFHTPSLQDLFEFRG